MRSRQIGSFSTPRIEANIPKNIWCKPPTSLRYHLEGHGIFVWCVSSPGTWNLAGHHFYPTVYSYQNFVEILKGTHSFNNAIYTHPGLYITHHTPLIPWFHVGPPDLKLHQTPSPSSQAAGSFAGGSVRWKGNSPSLSRSLPSSGRETHPKNKGTSFLGDAKKKTHIFFEWNKGRITWVIFDVARFQVPFEVESIFKRLRDEPLPSPS